MFRSSDLSLGFVTRRVIDLVGMRGGRLSPVARLLMIRKLPGLARLSYRLLRDNRVPLSAKLMAGGALALIFSPIDVLQFVPIVGQVSDLFLAMTTLETFVHACPQDVVREHRQALRMHV